MDDEKILMRGGDERDIEEYAKQNGADNTTHTKEPWRKELKDLFIRAGFDLEDRAEESDFGSVQIWKETEKVIEFALQSRDREIVGIINEVSALLDEIGSGPFSRDQMEHAKNTIENAVDIAKNVKEKLSDLIIATKNHD